MNSAPRQPVFCTACGEQLDEFCFSRESHDLETLRAHAFRCHLEGRNTGGMCAKLYIADDAHPAQPGDPAPATPQPGDSVSPPAIPASDDALRDAIMARIMREGDTPAEESPAGRGPVS